jgi:uncharacterized protein (DUF1778 family)
MAVVPYTIDSAASGRYFLLGGTAASSVTTILREVVSDSSTEFDLPREIRMSQRDFKLFLVALEADEEPNDKLRALFHNPE